MFSGSLLYASDYKINDDISIRIPTVGEVMENEETYYSLLYILTATPFDLMAQLDEAGIDFTKITDYELFCLLFPCISNEDTSLIFGDLDLSNFRPAIDMENNNRLFIDPDNDIKFDKGAYQKVVYALRKMHHLEACHKRPGNEEARLYLIEKARKSLRRHRRKKHKSQLEPLIIAMVNSEQYKYNFKETKNLSIYQFNESVRQVLKKVEYDNKMYGVYSGSIKASDLSTDEFSWISI